MMAMTSAQERHKFGNLGTKTMRTGQQHEKFYEYNENMNNHSKRSPTTTGVLVLREINSSNSAGITVTIAQQ